MKKNLVSQHAKAEKSHCLAPGLFRSVKKGDKKKLKLDVVYEFGNGRRIEFSGPDILGADDLRVLQGLLAIATSKRGTRVSSLTQIEGEQHLRSLIELKWDAQKDDVLVIKTSYRALAMEIGYANVDNANHIRECMERLWKVSIIAQVGNKRRGFRLLSQYTGDAGENPSNDSVQIALNPLIMSAILGEQAYAYIDMDEVRKIKSDVTRIIHYRLCGWIDKGKTGHVGIDTLCEYAWLEKEDSNITETVAKMKAKWKRRQCIRKALSELNAMGWDIEEYQENQFKITRPI